MTPPDPAPVSRASAVRSRTLGLAAVTFVILAAVVVAVLVVLPALRDTEAPPADPAGSAGAAEIVESYLRTLQAGDAEALTGLVAVTPGADDETRLAAARAEIDLAGGRPADTAITDLRIRGVDKGGQVIVKFPGLRTYRRELVREPTQGWRLVLPEPGSTS